MYIYGHPGVDRISSLKEPQYILSLSHFLSTSGWLWIQTYLYVGMHMIRFRVSTRLAYLESQWLRILGYFNPLWSTSRALLHIIFWAAVDSEKLEYGPGTICADFPSSLGFGAGGQSYSNFLASTVLGFPDIAFMPILGSFPTWDPSRCFVESRGPSTSSLAAASQTRCELRGAPVAKPKQWYRRGLNDCQYSGPIRLCL